MAEQTSGTVREISGIKLEANHADVAKVATAWLIQVIALARVNGCRFVDLEALMVRP